MRIDHLSDEALCAHVARGNDEALAVLHRRHAAVVRAAAVRRLRDAQRAEDLVQEVFLDVWRGAARYDARKARFSTWVRTIAARRMTDFERRAAARPPLQTFEGREPPVADPSDDTLRRLVLDSALAELPDAQRRTLRLAFWGGLSYDEIAQRTTTPLGTVKSRALLGMRRLESALGPAA